MNMPKGKQFEFSPNQIFGKFDLFCRRVSKLIELFGTIQQFETLGKNKLENIDEIINTFNASVEQFRKKKHKLLNFKQTRSIETLLSLMLLFRLQNQSSSYTFKRSSKSFEALKTP